MNPNSQQQLQQQQQDPESLKKVQKIEGKIKNQKVKFTTFTDRDYIVPSNATAEDKNKFFNYAEVHRLATRIGDEEILEKNATHNHPKNCPCCGRYVDKTPLKVGCKTTDLDFLGSGFPLFFEFIKYCAYFLIILILSTGSYNFFSNALKPDCKPYEENKDNHCNLTWISRFSLADKRHNEDLNDLQGVLNLFSIAALIVLLQFFRRHQREIDQKCDNGDINPTDYTIIIKDLPSRENSMSKKEIAAFLNDTFDKDNLLEDRENNIARQEIKDHHISFSYNISNLVEKKGEKSAKIVEYQSLLSAHYGTNPDRNAPMDGEQNIIQEITNIEEECNAIEKEFTREPETDETKQKFNGICLVTLQYEHLKEQILEKYGSSGLECRGENTRVSQAPDPTDVFWENLHYTSSQKRMRRFASFLINSFTLFLCFLVIFYLSTAQRNLIKKYDTGFKDICTVHANKDITNTDTGIYHNTELEQQSQYIAHSHLESEQQRQFIKKTLSEQQKKEQNNKSFIMKKIEEELEKFEFAGVDGEDSGDSSDSDDLQDLISQYRVKMITLLISLVVIPGFNAVLLQVMTRTTDFEKYSTRTENQISLATKLTIGTFFNTALQTFIIKIVILWANECLESARQAVFQDGGLIYTQQNVLMMNAIQAPIIYLMDPSRYLKKAMKWWYMDKNRDTCVKTQFEANFLVEEQEYIIAPRYAFILSSMFTTAFYAPLLPIGLVWTLLGLLIVYWIEKLMLTKFRIVKFNLSSKLSTEMTELLELFLPIYCIGTMIFEYLVVKTQETHPNTKLDAFNDMYNTSTFSAKLGIFVGIVHCLLPMKKINEFIMPTDYTIHNTISYNQAAPNFGTTYKMENPATKEITIERRAEGKHGAIQHTE